MSAVSVCCFAAALIIPEHLPFVFWAQFSSPHFRFFMTVDPSERLHNYDVIGTVVEA